MRYQARSTVESLESNGITARLTAARPFRGSGAPFFALLGLLAGVVIAFSASPALAAESCPNEQLRSENNSQGLPDCRAYEQVTPPFKEGHLAFTAQGFIGSSSVISPSFGVFAGAEDGNFGTGVTGTPYQFTRGSEGWEATSLTPSATEFAQNQGNIRLASPDLSAVAFVVSKRTSQKVLELYVRKVDGTLMDLGNLYPGSGEEGELGNGTFLRYGSEGLSHILATATSRWPGDTTVGFQPSLVEFAPGRTEPLLVAIKNAGSISSNSEAELISRCGESMHFAESGYQEQSADGETAFFTVEPCFEEPGEPEVAEIYARIGGEKTLNISQPILPPGEECTGICATAERKPAQIQYATASGKQVFFLTEQPLLNADKDETADLYEVEISGKGSSAAVSRVVDVTQGGSGDLTPGEGAEALGWTAASADGSRVYVVARGKLTNAPNVYGAEAQGGGRNLYLVEPSAGKTKFIASLNGEDTFDWGEPYTALRGVTTDGRYLTFASVEDLTPDDTSSVFAQIFQYDAQTESLTRVTAGEEGFNDDGNSSEDLAFLGEAKALTNDGVVFFQTSAALTPGATEDPQHLRRNIYEYQRGHVYLIAPGSTLNYIEASESATRLWGVDPSGENVYFQTGNSLVPSDADTQIDLYDARVDGGFAAPNDARCEGEACQGAVSAAPAGPSPGTSTFSGPGNPKPKKHKKKPRKKSSKTHKKKKGSSKKNGKHGGSKKGRVR